MTLQHEVAACSAPALVGVYRVTLPVSDVRRSVRWYCTHLGYRVVTELADAVERKAAYLSHPFGGPELVLRLDPERAETVAGFDSFAFGISGEAAIRDLARRLDAAGRHAGVHLTANGWVLPLVHDPDGRELQFYARADPAHRPLRGRQS